MVRPTPGYVLTDADIPWLGIQLVTERPDISWPVTPDGKPRPASEVEQEKYEARKLRDDWNWLYSPDAGLLPPPVPAPAVAVPAAPQHIARPFVAPPAPAPEAPADPAPVLGPVAELAMERFQSQHDAQDEREATAVIPVADAITTTAPAVTEGGAA
jgi:hypothetical protein